MIADNSEDGAGSRLARQRFPWVRAVEFGDNLGFGAALNRAVREVPGDPIVFLNDDVTAEPGFVTGLIEALDPEIEMVAAVLLTERDPGRIDSAGVVADRTLLGFDYLNGEPVGALERRRRPTRAHRRSRAVPARRLRAVGGFDERIFLYYEDLDLALRMRRAARSAGLRQARGGSTLTRKRWAPTGRKYAMTGWSRGYMLRIYGFGRQPALLARAICVEAAICAGQLASERTLRGLRGRLRGWRAAKALPRRKPPEEGPLPISLREALSLRRRRHGS